MFSKKILRQFLCIAAALSTGVVANLGCVSSAQLRDFVFREFANVAADFIAHSLADGTRGGRGLFGR